MIIYVGTNRVLQIVIDINLLAATTKSLSVYARKLS